MFYRQSCILAFMSMAFVRLSTAAHFDCNSDTGFNINCFVTLNGDNTFWINAAHGQSCTHDGKYCASVSDVGQQAYVWQIEVTNRGESCSDVCYAQESCDVDNECTGSCSIDTC